MWMIKDQAGFFFAGKMPIDASHSQTLWVKNPKRAKGYGHPHIPSRIKILLQARYGITLKLVYSD